MIRHYFFLRHKDITPRASKIVNKTNEIARRQGRINNITSRIK